MMSMKHGRKFLRYQDREGLKGQMQPLQESSVARDGVKPLFARCDLTMNVTTDE